MVTVETVGQIGVQGGLSDSPGSVFIRRMSVGASDQWFRRQAPKRYVDDSLCSVLHDLVESSTITLKRFLKLARRREV